ncbi:MAG: AsmA family protein [Hyphomicrobiales bacterium]
MLRRFLVSIVGLIALLLIVLAVSFLLVPKERLNALIAKQLSEAFGHTVVVTGRPSVSLLPYLSVSFGPLAVAAAEEGSAPLIEIERANGRLSVTSLWEGNPSLRFIVLERANVSLVRKQDGKSNWSTARLFIEDRQGPSNAPALRFPTRLRSIKFTDSTLTVDDETMEKPETFTGINATIVGPPRSQKFAINGSMIWRGELAEFSATMADPGVMMAGGTTKADFTIESAPVVARFNGDVVWKEKLQGDGIWEADIPSAGKLVEWIGVKGADALPADQLRILGDGVFTDGAFEFRPISVRLGDGKADGRLKVSVAEGAVGLSGTLAFDQLLLGEIGIGGQGGNNLLEDLLKTSQSGAVVDLRLSAETARIGMQDANNMAVGLLLKDNNLVVNVGAMELAGADNLINGKLGGELTISKEAEVSGFDANLTLSETSFASISQPTSVPLPFEGDISLTLQMRAKGESQEKVVNSFEVEAAAHLKQGVLKEVALDKMSDPAALEAGTVNGMDEQTDFETGEIQAIIRADGNMEITKFVLKTEQNEFSSSGVIDLVENRLSLLGVAKKKSDDDSSEGPLPAIPFSLGGTMSKPKVTSVAGKAL